MDSLQKVIKVAALLTVFLASNSAYAYTIDGKYQDWINSPFTDWTPISDTAYFTDGNNKKGPKVHHNPAEIWDKEWLAFDYDGNNLYIAGIASSKLDFGWDTDLAISLSGGEEYEFGVNLQNYGTLGTTKRDVVDVDEWQTEHHGEWDLPLRINSGNFVGLADFAQADLGWIEPGVGYKRTYFFEGSIDLSLLGLAELCDIDIEIITTYVSCLKDSLVVGGRCTGPGCQTEVPEPATVLLLGSALVGLRKVRKDKLGAS